MECDCYSNVERYFTSLKLFNHQFVEYESNISQICYCFAHDCKLELFVVQLTSVIFSS